MGDVKRQWVAAVENMATETYPDWRALFQRSGRWRLPSELRKELNPVQAWKGPRVDFIKGLLQWLHAAVDQKVIELMCTKLNAVLEFAVFVTREFLLGNYSLEKHDSDIFDQFQLQYLAMSEFVVVSGDADLLLRTKRSAQASRIMSFDQFLRTI
jgi:hypothetical protein